MKNLKLFIVFFVCFILQSTLLRHISILGISPNLILVLVMVFAFYFENYKGIVMGIIFGLMQDLAFGQIIGISALIYFTIGMGLQFFRVSVYRDNILVILATTLVGTTVYALLYWVLSILLLDVSFSIITVLKYIPVSVILNFLFMIITVHFARRIKGFKA